MAAKDWAPLRDALWRHVREPLLRDHTDTWNGIKPGDTIPFEHRRQLANNGRISATDNKAAVLWYTLVYGCMHYDALSALMGRQEFKGLVHGALNRPSKPHSRSIPHSFPDRRSDRPPVSPCLVHVDFGCGPGTAAWAVINALSNHAAITTLGHDHNPCMAELAQEITADVIKSVDRRIDHEFFSDWNTFEKTAKWSRSLRGCDAVLVTVNSLFTQPSVNREEIDSIVRLIKLILEVLKSVERNSPVIAIGTHPDYTPMKDEVADGWRRIGNISGRRTRYDGNVQFESWSPLCFGDYEPSDEAAWDQWAGSTWQLAHVLKVR